MDGSSYSRNGLFVSTRQAECQYPACTLFLTSIDLVPVEQQEGAQHDQGCALVAVPEDMVLGDSECESSGLKGEVSFQVVLISPGACRNGFEIHTGTNLIKSLLVRTAKLLHIACQQIIGLKMFTQDE